MRLGVIWDLASGAVPVGLVVLAELLDRHMERGIESA